MVNNYFNAYLLSLLTNLLGFLFLSIQYLEYKHLKFGLSDTVYCSLFYLLTGFHGVHVFLGNLLLIIQYSLKFLYASKSNLGLALALIYWHFVDII
jgi:cytochrome c oxidase subunit III